MDTSLLNLEEHFSTCYVYNKSDDLCGSSNQSYFNEWEDERELNGDIGLIPESSGFSDTLKDMSEFTDSPPSLLFQKMFDFSAYIYVDGVEAFPNEPGIEPTNDLINNFDLPSFINESNNETKREVKSIGKKIDVDAQKYIIEEKDTSEEIDVETVFEGASLPVLEANDAFSLLEQFEASEKPNLVNSNKFESSIEKIPEAPIEIFEEEKKSDESPTTKANSAQPYVKNKQIRDALPQELISRINESGKRKPITVIPPIPAKRRGIVRPVDITNRTKIQKTSNEQIKLDHDYCASSSPYPKEPRKDSGFQSEEDDRSILRNQPTVKTADGKLMVSLLKVNTIKNSINQKKKLNLEEYKKRRFIHSNSTSQNNSPSSSTCSSPLPEDEHVKRIKHQEKLMKMAADLLNTPAKSSKPAPIICKTEQVKVEEKKLPPPDLEVKTYINISTNTEISSIDSSKSIIASSHQLEDIKPLLQKVSDKISSNSFITSLIENIPKVQTESYVDETVVREDTIIHYLKKDRIPAKTETRSTQTDFDIESRYRRRIDERSSSVSSSSGSSSRSSRSRRRSRSSSSRSSRSRSDSSSSSRSSRSRSRSSGKRRQYSAERLREVEERRVVYVGRLMNGATKEDLRRRFSLFGRITYISLHFRDYGDNYGFVTFENKEDAYEAVEHGNDHSYPKYDLSFGGRRIFCKTSYSDLDNMRDDDFNYYANPAPENSFDALLRAAQEKLRKRKP